jgi:hypothetical protein
MEKVVGRHYISIYIDRLGNKRTWTVVITDISEVPIRWWMDPENGGGKFI